MGIEQTEIGRLIGSDKVEGTLVFAPDGTQIGTIERVMIDKLSGKVSYAVLAFGGFLGLGHEHYPLSWNSLKYNVDLGGYQTSVTRDQLDAAPKYSAESEWDWSDPLRARAVDDYYAAA